MNRFIVTAFFIICLISYVTGQTKESNSKVFNSAVEEYQNGNHQKALELFKTVLDSEPENEVVMFYVGSCYLESNNVVDSALIYFDKAVHIMKPENYNTKFGIDLFMAYAKADQLTYHFEDAIKIYKNVLGYIDSEAAGLNKEVNREIEICNNALTLIKTPVKLKVKNLGPNVNSKYDDHSPLVNAEESLLIFTSRQVSSYSQYMDDGQFAEKIYMSRGDSGNWSKSEVIKSIVEKNSHDAGLCLSADGTELYLVRSDTKGRNLYVSNYDGETWSEPYMLPEGINSRYDETHASITADKSILFFTSNRPGGSGGLDIYMVRKLPNGKWAAPKNMGDVINTPYDEETPMIHPNGKVLYFSSKGHNTMGGYDIFYSIMNNDSTWSEPVNMGYPINTPDDDFFFVPAVKENKAYMASARFEDNYGGSDLYEIDYEAPQIQRLAIVKGQLTSDKKDVDWGDVRITVNELGKNAVVGVYKPNPETGKYIMILEADKRYDIKFSGEGIEENEDVLDVTKNMTYHNSQQTVEVGTVNITMKEPKKEEKKKSGLLVDRHGKYTVQFMTLHKKVELTHKDFENLDKNKIFIIKCDDGGKYRYVYGDFDTFKNAKKAKQEILNNSHFKDSFVRYYWQLDGLNGKEE